MYPNINIREKIFRVKDEYARLGGLAWLSATTVVIHVWELPFVPCSNILNESGRSVLALCHPTTKKRSVNSLDSED